ncbi:MAG: MMPL family transporter [Gammaproteobacteria bacterium]|nr:MMPL family transporter [Gammaproteobacteria bacterium]
MAKSLIQLILKYKWMSILFSLLVVFSLAAGMKNLTFTNDYRVFFGPDNPQLVAFEGLQDTYSKNDNVMIVLVPKDGNAFSKQMMQATLWLTQESWKTPYSSRVDSLTNFQHTKAEGDDLIVEDLVYEDTELTDDELDRVKDIALKEPLLVNRLVSPKAHVTGVNITIQLKGEDVTKENPEVVSYIRDLKAQFLEKYPDIDVKLTGIIFMNAAFPEASQYDMQNLVPFMFLMFLIILYFWVRGFSGTITTFLIIIFCIISAMGAAGWLGISLTPPSFSAIMIIPTMAIADSVHVLMSFLQSMRHGENKHDAMVESIRINFQPIFLTSVTTAIGFLSMNFSDSPPFHDLGNIVAMGVMMAFFLSILFLPPMMMLLPVKVTEGESRTSSMMISLGDWVVAKQKILMIVMIIFSIGLVSFVPKNQLNDEFVKYFSEEIEFRRDSDFASDNLSGLYLIDYSLDSGSSGSVSDPEFMRTVEDFANWYREQPEVIHVNVLTDVFKRLNRNMHGDDPEKYKIPESRELAAQYLLLYEMSLPLGLDLNNQINIAKTSTRMTVMMYNISTSQVLDLEERALDWLKQNAQASMHQTGASPTVMFSHIGYRNIRSMLIGTMAALLLISIILIFALRSLKVGLISLIPNLIPAGLAFGLWGILDGQVGMGLSVVTGMTLGIVVDDTVHFLSKYLRARREKGLDAEDAVRYAFKTVGLALTVTSIVLTAGFIVLSMSAFNMNADMAIMTAFTISLALLADFLLLPPLLMKLDKDNKKLENTHV